MHIKGRKILSLVLLLLFFLSGCKANDKEAFPALKKPVEQEMETAIVSRGDIFELKTYDAKVYPDLKLVYPEKDGAMKEVTVYIGQEVKKGDVLAYLDDKEISDKIEQLEESIEDARVNNNFNNRHQELDIQIQELNIKQKIESNASELEIAQMQSELEKLEITRQQDLKQQEYELEKLNDRLKEAKTELENTVIKAPSSGEVVYISTYNKGDMVSKDNPLIIITDESKLHLQSEYMEKYIFTDASQVYALINGRKYDIEYVPLESSEVVKMQDSGIDIESRYTIKGDTGNIASGDYACICVKNKVKENVINIPKNALYSDSEGKFVYRMTDGVFSRCNIETGIETDIQVEIISGLEEGDVIYVQGA